MRSGRDEAGRVVAGVAGPDAAHAGDHDHVAAAGPRGDGARAGSQAYLVATDALRADRADLTAGRWPAPAATRAEVAVPDTTARLLGLGRGDEVTLGGERGLGGVDGTVAARGGRHVPAARRLEWERDPLGGAGFAPAYSDGLEAAPTYGPFVVDEQAFLAAGPRSTRSASPRTRSSTCAGDSRSRRPRRLLDDAPGLLAARVGDRARLTRLASDLPRTLARLHAQRASTAAPPSWWSCSSARRWPSPPRSWRDGWWGPSARTSATCSWRWGSGAASSWPPRPRRPRSSRSWPRRSPYPLRRSSTRA